MGKPHPIELRERVVAFVEEGHTHRAAAAHFRTSISFVNNMVKLKYETGALAPKPQGHGGKPNKVTRFDAWARAQIATDKNITLQKLRDRLAADHGVEIAVSTAFYWLRRLGFTHKKRPASD